MNLPSNGSPFNAPVEVIYGRGHNANKEYCNARDLHQALEVETKFATWFNRRVQEYGFMEGQDYFPILGNRSGSHSGKHRSEYHISLGMAKELAMVEKTQVGRQVRRYFIQVEQHARALLEEQANQVQPIEQVKSRIKDTGKFKYLIVLQEQSRAIAKALSNETNPAERYNLHCQLRQVNEALGIPTLPLESIGIPGGNSALSKGEDFSPD